MVEEYKKRLLNNCKYLQSADFIQIEKAIDFAEHAHIGQLRATGEPYIIHPIEVCFILSEFHADAVSLLCALLHDVVEDTSITLPTIQEKFGEEVAFIVDGLTKLEKGSLEKEEYSAANMEKLLIAAMTDIRIAAVKLADRLHNMRTLEVKNIEKKIPYANETLLYFSPLAEKVGLFKLQEELEELGFRYLNESRYKHFYQLMLEYSTNYQETFEQFTKGFIQKDLQKVAQQIEWKCTPIYKAYNLLGEDGHWEDLFTVYITTKNTKDCYTCLGIVHSVFEPMNEQFKDSISINIHPYMKYLKTKVKVGQNIVNVTIQEEKTSVYRESGLFEKIKETDISALSKALLGDTIQTVKSVADSSIAFCDLVSFELFQKEIIVFTPRMDVIRLPKNSNIIDFAYALDPELANKLVFAKVNGVAKSVQSQLQELDIVDLYVKDKITVNAKWLHYVQTSKAIKEIGNVVNNDKGQKSE